MLALLLASAMPILTSCVTTMASSEIDAAHKKVMCEAFQPITWSGKDTDDTIRGVKEHNAVWTALCKP